MERCANGAPVVLLITAPEKPRASAGVSSFIFQSLLHPIPFVDIICGEDEERGENDYERVLPENGEDGAVIAPEEIAEDEELPDADRNAGEIERKEGRIRHLVDAGQEWRYPRYRPEEPREEDAFRPIFLKEVLPFPVIGVVEDLVVLVEEGHAVTPPDVEARGVAERAARDKHE